MAGCAGVPGFDTMIGSTDEEFDDYDFIGKRSRDRESREKFEFPVEYMFKGVPKDLPTSDPIAVTLHEMDRFGIQQGLIGVADKASRLALKKYPDRFVPSG